MNKRSIAILASLAAALLATLGPLQAHGAVMLNRITGVVTAPTTSDRIVVDGRNYHIVAGSAAANERNNVRVGQTVDLVFSPKGGAGAATSTNVIGITIHAPGAGAQ